MSGRFAGVPACPDAAPLDAATVGRQHHFEFETRRRLRRDGQALTLIPDRPEFKGRTAQDSGLSIESYTAPAWEIRFWAKSCQRGVAGRLGHGPARSGAPPDHRNGSPRQGP